MFNDFADHIAGSDPAGGPVPYDLDWPMFGLVSDVRGVVRASLAAGRPVVLATLVQLEGGGPRPLGTQMAFTEDEIGGFLSGGCIEGDLALHAQKLLSEGGTRRIVYGRGSPYFDIRLLCGVSLAIVLERLLPNDDAARRLLDLTMLRQSFTWISNGTQRCCLANGQVPPDQFADAVAIANNSAESAGEFGSCYWVRYRPRLRLFVSGRDPSALALAGLASQADVETILMRENGPSSVPLRSLERYCRGPAELAFRTVGVDERSAIVAANHDLDADHDVLVAGLHTDAAYVGVIGSRRYFDSRIDRLLAAGLSDAQVSRLVPSCGAFHAKTPWEMAISVLSQVLPKFSSNAR